MPALLPSAPASAALPRVQERGWGVRRWTGPLGLVALLSLLGTGLSAAPRPVTHGAGLAVLLGLLCLAAGGLGLLLELRTNRMPVPLQVVSLLLMIAGSVPLIWLQPDGPGFLGGFVAAGAASARLPHRIAPAIAGTALVALAFAAVVGAHRPLMTVLVSELGVLAFYRVGRFAVRLRERTEQAESLLVELEQTREAQVRAATLAERARLAREMHDVLAHSLSGLVVHLEGARLLAAREGAEPKLADTVERAHHLAQAGLGEARQAIGMLRDADLPGPERLPDLACQFEADTGLPCAVTVAGSPAELDPQARLTLYRVAQEALTNVRRHAADPARVELRLEYRPDGTCLVVTDTADTGPGIPAAPGDSNDSNDSNDGGDRGYGVSGMRERAELLGGTLSAQPTGTGFRVALFLPAAVPPGAAGGPS